MLLLFFLSRYYCFIYSEDSIYHACLVGCHGFSRSHVLVLRIVLYSTSALTSPLYPIHSSGNLASGIKKAINLIRPRDAILCPDASNSHCRGFVCPHDSTADIPGALGLLAQVFRGIGPGECVPICLDQYQYQSVTHAGEMEVPAYPAPVVSLTITSYPGQWALPSAFA